MDPDELVTALHDIVAGKTVVAQPLPPVLVQLSSPAGTDWQCATS
jgi:hypothetical protein